MYIVYIFFESHPTFVTSSPPMKWPHKHPNTCSQFFCKMDYLKKFSFPFDIIGWNKLTLESESPGVGVLLKFIKPIKESIFNSEKCQ